MSTLIKWNKFMPPFLLDEDNWPTLSNWPDSMQQGGLDIYETAGDVVVEAQVPGIPQDKVEVLVEGNVLTIKAELKETEEEKNKKQVVYKSSRQTCFNYSTSLPRMVDSSKAQAVVEDGVVKVIIPKVEEEKPKKINVTKK